MKLHELRDNPGARKTRTRLGRGVGSGKGKTAARGVKGQKSRSGVAIKGFEGGQMPIHMRKPKRGFNNAFRKRYALLDLRRLQAAVDTGKLTSGQSVDAKTLVEAGVIRRVHEGVRLVANGELSTKLSLKVAHASAAAKTAVEKAGGEVILEEMKAGQGQDTAGAQG